MRGAHTSRSAPPALPVQRSRRVTHRTAVGWWQPPRAREAAEDSARHRSPGVAEVRERVRGAGRPAALLRRASRHRRGPTAGRRGRWRRRIRWAVLGGVAAVVLGPVLAFAAGYLVLDVPGPDDAVDNQVALVSFADGSRLTRLVPEEGNRVKVDLAQVPVHVREAVLAAEDRTFYSNPGFDLTGIVRAAWNQLRGGSGGGSTITQQFVKKAMVGDEPTLWRKFEEVVLAVKISQERSKDQILADYLNTIYFGRGAYGIQSASQAYFGTGVEDLTAAQGALLAGVIQSPSRWDPAVDPERAVQRWNFVLDGMVAEGWLDPATRRAAPFPATVPRRAVTGGVPPDDRGHVVTAVVDELRDLGISEQDLAQEGLRITTTVDRQRQRQAAEAARSALAGQPADLRSAMVAIDPQTGGVLAYYGGDNGLGLDYARVRRLAGSTFKPFVVLAGLLADPPVGLGRTFDGTAVPGLRNAEGAECDRCDLKQAMTVSNNVVFSTLARQIGPESVARAARAAGITAPLDDPDEGIALGNKEVSTVELASAYATIAAGGVWRPPHLVASVVTADGRLLYEASREGERRFPERVARNVTETMLGVAARDGLALPGGRPVAAKTGTVESRFEGENNDAWTAGFTPSLAASVWMGTDRNSPIRTAGGAPIDGGGLPGDVWQRFMTGALDDGPVERFAPFQPIGEPPAAAPPGATPAPVTPGPSVTATPGPPAGPSAAPTAAPDLPAPTGAPERTPGPPGAPPSGAPATPGPPSRTPAAAPADGGAGGPAPGPPASPAPAASGAPDCASNPCG